jgi:glutamate---methylamine ligase
MTTSASATAAASSAPATSYTAIAKERGIRSFLVSYTDLFGCQRAKLVPAVAMDQVAKAGAGFAGFATWLDMTPADPDLLAKPDPKTITQLPWKPEVAWVAADLIMGGKPVEQAPRQVLRRQLERAATRGLAIKTGVECEFFLMSRDQLTIGDGEDRQAKPCYDQQALMRRYELIAKVSECMEKLGWGPYQSDHEDANGQFEMNWGYDDALVTADRHTFFKFMIKSLAEAHGLRATFMPKPFARMTGTGCHVHVSFWDERGAQNRFQDKTGELGLSSTAYHAIGGLMQHADAMCAITNPTVNSYKRLNARPTTSGASWSPNAISYTGNNRTHMIRIPDDDRFEFRLADGAVNPYLLPAVVSAACLDGIEQRRDPGKRHDYNMYTHPPAEGTVRRLPANLLDALRVFRDAKEFRAALGEDFSRAYVTMKQQEWNEYASQVSDWELQSTLDC